MGVKVRQKVKGKGKPWWVFVIQGGRRTSKQIGDKAAAEAVVSKLRAQMRSGESFSENGKEEPVATFGRYADDWIKTNIPATCKSSTLRDYTDILNNHVLPTFGEIGIVKVTRGRIKGFLLSKIAEGYAASTVSHMKDVISGVMNKALDDEVIAGNPARDLRIIRRKQKSHSIDPLTAIELATLIRSTAKLFPHHYTLILLLARTGMRIGEALALKWGDIDFNGRFFNVKRSFSRGKVTTTKNGKSRRVDISLQLAASLQHHRTDSIRKGLSLGLGRLPDYVFTNENGNLIDKDNWRRRVFKKALEKAGLRKIRS